MLTSLRLLDESSYINSLACSLFSSARFFNTATAGPGISYPVNLLYKLNTILFSVGE
jgi:hypothetical protein